MKAKLADIAKKASRASKLQVGFPPGATYQDGTPVALVAACQEFGTSKIPPRPFLRPTIEAGRTSWPAAIAALMKESDCDAGKALATMGLRIGEEIQKAIVDTDAPALSVVTVMLRGMRSQARYRDLPFYDSLREAVSRVEAGKTTYGASTKPLVDSGTMLRSVVSIVDGGETTAIPLAQGN